MKQICLYGLESIPEVKAGDDLVRMIHDACSRESVQLTSGDVIMITSKIVSKAEGRTLNVRGISPSRRARAISRITRKNPFEVEIILRESKSIQAVVPVKKIVEHYPQVFDNLVPDSSLANQIVEREPSVLITVTKQGALASDAGLDFSNNPDGTCTVLPNDPSDSARRIRQGLSGVSGVDVAVVVTDTEVNYSHLYGSIDIAIGFSGISPVARRFGSKDRFGREKFGGVDLIVDELASAAALLMGQTSEGIPVVIARNVAYEKDDTPMPASIPIEVLSKVVRWSLFSTLKLRLVRLFELFT